MRCHKRPINLLGAKAHLVTLLDLAGLRWVLHREHHGHGRHAARSRHTVERGRHPPEKLSGHPHRAGGNGTFPRGRPQQRPVGQRASVL